MVRMARTPSRRWQQRSERMLGQQRASPHTPLCPSLTMKIRLVGLKQ
ncbi:hypothetical protein PC119_g24119 [Phytophthora cactorum]|nr:hypothetical protein PC114_g24547 [Phytophthora cactorum]KAG2968854.1 hypothetical protein PC119_g24119 [Phytophthora cactorum]